MIKPLFIALAAAAAVGSSASAAPAMRLSRVTDAHGWNMTFLTFEYDSQDRMSRIVQTGGLSATYDYSRLSEGIITVTQDDEEDIYIYTAYLDAAGRVTRCEESGSSHSAEWTVEYNADGNLSSITTQERGDARPSVYDLTYADGTLTGWTFADNSVAGRPEVSVAAVTSTDMANRPGMCLVAGYYGIDLDGLAYLEIAGRMGVPSAKLPASVGITQADDVIETYVYTWTAGTDGYPSQLKQVYTYDGDADLYEFGLVWERYSGIDTVDADRADDTVTAVYGPDGVRRAGLLPGLNILVHGDGTVTKRIVRQ